MSNPAEQLEALRLRIAARNEAEGAADSIGISQAGEVFHLNIDGGSETFEDLMDTLAKPDVAPFISSLVLRRPDEGANGTNNWDIELLVQTEAMYSQLEAFSIQLGQPADHNRSIVAASYDEDGVLARLLAKSPRLQALTAPSAPDTAFFEVGERPLRFMSIDAGYDTQNFILNLARSSCFPDLQCFEWGEYRETYVDDYLDNCTPIEHYRELFQSPAFRSVRRFVWRNPACANEEIRELKATTRPDLQLLVVRYSCEYV